MKKNPSLPFWQSSLRKAFSLRLGSWVAARTLHHLDRHVYRLSNGRFTAVSLLGGVPVITLTTTGAKSGLPRSVPLIGIPTGDDLILVASNWGQDRHPSWYYNLRANPRIKVSTSDSEQDYMAHEVTGEDRDWYWKKATEIYGGYEAYKRRVGERQIPIVILSPINQSS